MEASLDFNSFASLNHGTVSRLPVLFYEKTVLDKVKTQEEGSPVFAPKDFIKIFVPGGKNVVEREAKEEDKQLYAAQYAQYKAKQEQRGSGVPLKACPVIEMHEVAHLESHKIYTLEQLAEYPDSGLKTLGMKGFALRKAAKDYLKIAKDMAVVAKQEEQLEKRDKEIETLKDELIKLKALVSGSQGKERPTRKRREVDPDAPIKRRRSRSLKKQEQEDLDDTTRDNRGSI